MYKDEREIKDLGKYAKHFLVLASQMWVYGVLAGQHKTFKGITLGPEKLCRFFHTFLKFHVGLQLRITVIFN